MTGPTPVSGLLILSFGAKASDFSLETQPWLHRAWLEIGAALYFSLAFDWFHSIWACFLYLAASIVLAWLVCRWIARRTEAMLKARFQRDLTERIRNAHDLHDTMLQTIEASKLIADDALDAPADPASMRRAMRRLSGWLGQATQEGQTVLHLLHAPSFVRNELASKLQRFAETSIIHRSVDFALSVIGESIDMKPAIRDEVYWIGCEGIRNAYNLYGATYLRIALTYDRDFCLQIEDNGRPIEIDDAETSEMQVRAQRFGGKLSLIRTSGSRTKLTLTVPGNIGFRHTP